MKTLKGKSRRLEKTLQEAIIREQRRIARDLHDGLGQELLGLSLLAAGLAAEHTKTRAKLARDLGLLAKLASRSLSTCRSLALGFFPLKEYKNSLAGALRRLAVDNTGLARGPTVIFSEASSAASLLSPAANNQLYRIAQEALNNAMKHSRASIVQIQLCIDRHKVGLRIGDDGHGIGARISPLRRMGLQSMRDRATSVGGRLSISSNGQSGTLIRCECHNQIGPITSF